MTHSPNLYGMLTSCVGALLELTWTEACGRRGVIKFIPRTRNCFTTYLLIFKSTRMFYDNERLPFFFPLKSITGSMPHKWNDTLLKKCLSVPWISRPYSSALSSYFKNFLQVVFLNVHGNNISSHNTSAGHLSGTAGQIFYVTPKSLQAGSGSPFSHPSGIFSLIPLIPISRLVSSAMECPTGIKCIPLHPSSSPTPRTPFPGSLLPPPTATQFQATLTHQMISSGKCHQCCHVFRVFISGSAILVAICEKESRSICLLGVEM